MPDRPPADHVRQTSKISARSPAAGVVMATGASMRSSRPGCGRCRARGFCSASLQARLVRTITLEPERGCSAPASIVVQGLTSGLPTDASRIRTTSRQTEDLRGASRGPSDLSRSARYVFARRRRGAYSPTATMLRRVLDPEQFRGMSSDRKREVSSSSGGSQGAGAAVEVMIRHELGDERWQLQHDSHRTVRRCQRHVGLIGPKRTTRENDYIVEYVARR